MSMIVIGLTGSIAMGKTETAKMFASLGVPVSDSDAIVHELYDRGGAAVEPIGQAFPEAVIDGRVDRAVLSRRLAAEPHGFERLQAIVHPLVRQGQQKFLTRCRSEGAKLAVLDIPLLFEAGRDQEVDHIVVVSASPDIQKARAMKRAGMTEEKFKALLARQLPDEEKRARADFVVDTSKGLDHAFAQVRDIVARLMADSDL
jgi:dephospho-CoA kinase